MAETVRLLMHWCGSRSGRQEAMDESQGLGRRSARTADGRR